MSKRPLTSSHVLETPSGPIDIELSWTNAEDGLACTGLRLTATHRLDAATVKSLPLGDLLEQGRWCVAQNLAASDNDRIWALWNEQAGEHRRRREYGQDHYQLVADLYRTLMLKSSSKGTTRLAEHFGVDVATARRWIAKSKQLGLIPER